MFSFDLEYSGCMVDVALIADAAKIAKQMQKKISLQHCPLYQNAEAYLKHSKCYKSNSFISNKSATKKVCLKLIAFTSY